VAELSILTRAGAPQEDEAAERLRVLLSSFDLSRFLYTDRVVIDATARMSHSHPVLTLHPGHVLGPTEDVTLTVYLHEQMHWAAQTLAGFGPAIDEAKSRWPDPPGPTQGGAADPHSTWLHFPVCGLELAAMSEVVGEDRAIAAVTVLPWYGWIYGRLTGPDLPWREYLARHDLTLPDEPPPFAADLEFALGADVAALRAAVGDLPDVLADAPLDADLVVRIIALCCLTLDGRSPESAGAIDRRNAELYPLLDQRRHEVDEALALLKPLRDQSSS